MAIRCLSFSLLLVLATTNANAELIQFTLEGKLLDFRGTIAINVGDPVTIRYTAESLDVEPNPSHGTYRASFATLDFPSLQITSPPDGGGSVRVGPRLGYDSVWYLHGGGIDDRLSIIFMLPLGTLGSSELPLNLPNPTSGAFGLTAFGNNGYTSMSGSVTSYIGTIVPDPSAGLGYLAMAFACLCGRRMRCA